METENLIDNFIKMGQQLNSMGVSAEDLQEVIVRFETVMRGGRGNGCLVKYGINEVSFDPAAQEHQTRPLNQKVVLEKVDENDKHQIKPFKKEEIVYNDFN